MANIRTSALLIGLLLLAASAFAQITLPTPRVESVLYLGEGKKQPLVVGLGGSEGGNAWTSDHWKATRDEFLAKGYAFLAIGYFAAPGAPDTLNRIALEDVHHAIQTAAAHKQVHRKKIALIGGSRGADLALLLGSHYKDIGCVVSIVGSNAAFPGHTNHFSTSCWTFQGQELPFVPVNEAAIPFLMARDLRGTFEAMLGDADAVAKAAIPVERIQGPVLFLSATQDEICPSTPMADSMVERLKAAQFKYPYQHKAIEGGHTAPLEHFDVVFAFLAANFAGR
jgi:uncharacterized protein